MFKTDHYRVEGKSLEIVDLDKLRQLRAAGVQGEWYEDDSVRGYIRILAPDPMARMDDPRDLLIAQGKAYGMDDYRLIAAAVNAIVPLCDEIEALRTEIVWLRQHAFLLALLNRIE